jgi:ATP-dependent Clp protease ATP-binding subunit ClpA
VGNLRIYVGYEEDGQLTEAVRRKPYSVILWMRLKKASGHFNILYKYWMRED